MKKITALVLILLLVLSGCRLISDSDIYSDYAEVSVVSDGAAVSGAGGSAAESADSSASSENKNSSEYIISPADESKTEITVSVSEDEKVVPANGTGEIVNPVTPPPSDAEHDITVLPDFEEETTSELADTDSYNTDHTAVNQQDYYQYSQMTGKEKQIYGLLKSAVISCKNLVNVSGIGITADDAVLAIYRFRADYPQYFWLSHSFAFTYNSYTDTVSSINISSLYRRNVRGYFRGILRKYLPGKHQCRPAEDRTETERGKRTYRKHYQRNRRRLVGLPERKVYSRLRSR